MKAVFQLLLPGLPVLRSPGHSRGGARAQRRGGAGGAKAEAPANKLKLFFKHVYKHVFEQDVKINFNFKANIQKFLCSITFKVILYYTVFNINKVHFAM